MTYPMFLGNLISWREETTFLVIRLQMRCIDRHTEELEIERKKRERELRERERVLKQRTKEPKIN